MSIGEVVKFCGTERDVILLMTTPAISEILLSKKPVGKVVDKDTFCFLNRLVEFNGINTPVWVNDAHLEKFVEKKGKKK